MDISDALLRPIKLIWGLVFCLIVSLSFGKQNESIKQDYEFYVKFFSAWNLNDQSMMRELIDKNRFNIERFVIKLLGLSINIELNGNSDDIESAKQTLQLTTSMADLYAEKTGEKFLIEKARIYTNWSRQEKLHWITSEELIKKAKRAFQAADFNRAVKLLTDASMIIKEIGDESGLAVVFENIAMAYSKSGNKRKMFDYCYRALKIVKRINNRQGAAHILKIIGDQFQEQGEIQQALASYRESLTYLREIGNRDFENYLLATIGGIYMQLADKHKENNRLFQAVTYYKKSLGQTQNLADKTEAMVALFRIIDSLDQLGNDEEALKYSLMLLKTLKESGDTFQKYKADVLIDLGKRYQKLGDYPEAIVYFKAVVKLRPDAGHIWAVLGDLYASTSLFNKAIEAFERAIVFDSKDVTTWSNLGLAYSKVGLHKKGVNACLKAVEIDPASPLAWNNLGSVFRENGLYDDAIVTFKKTLKLDPNLGVAWNNLGISYANKGINNLALSAYKKALAINPQHQNAWFNLGSLHFLQKRVDDAIFALTRAVEIQPTDYQVWFLLGEVFEKKQVFYKAIEAFQKCISTCPLKNTREAAQKRIGAIKLRNKK